MGRIKKSSLCSLFNKAEKIHSIKKQQRLRQIESCHDNHTSHSPPILPLQSLRYHKWFSKIGTFFKDTLQAWQNDRRNIEL